MNSRIRLSNNMNIMIIIFRETNTFTILIEIKRGLMVSKGTRKIRLSKIT